MADGIRFWFRGEVVELDDVPATTSVLQWLRLTGASRGTKEGCNQGDCGACTVAIAQLIDGEVRLATANACLLLVPMLHGTALFTVEDAGTPGQLHPVQQALVDCAGSQCGFCTPGFVMSMWSAAERCAHEGSASSAEEIADVLTGNLCRCTGYRPIVDAAVRASAQTADQGGRLDWSELADQLAGLAQEASTATPTDFALPRTEAELGRLLAQRPEARIIAGGTDLVVAMRATGAILDADASFISVDGVDSLALVETTSDELVLGAGVSLERAWSVLVERIPSLARMHRRFASPAIRSRGTIGGNLANSSPIADLVPVLIALDASMELVSSAGTRPLPVESFATGVRTNALEPGEFVARIRIPLGSFDREVHAYKVARRFDDDISSVSAVLAVRSDAGRPVEARLVFGGLAATVRRAPRSEAELLAGRWDEATLRAVQSSLRDDFAPIDDHRATGWYRGQAAAGLLERWWVERTGSEAAQHDIWAVR